MNKKLVDRLDQKMKYKKEKVNKLLAQVSYEIQSIVNYDSSELIDIIKINNYAIEILGLNNEEFKKVVEKEQL